MQITCVKYGVQLDYEQMTQILLALATLLSTLAGGFFALRNSDRLHRILGFSAGVIIGVVAFDILPEIYRLASSTGAGPEPAMVALVLGFLSFHAIEKFVMVHGAHEGEYKAHHHPTVGLASALALSGHSFLDGVGIGLAFQINTTIGLAVALAVVAHDFADGLNTVGLMLVHKNSRAKAIRLLLVDAVAPVLGAASTLYFHVSDSHLLLYLGFFAGFLLYIGASDILPEAHADHPSRLTVLLTALGALFIYVVTTMLR
jgi:zinc transporter ZupT